MKIQLLLENIGPITKAKVNLKNLSIIVGANSIGKSLISKSTYITLRGLNLDDDSFTELINAEVYKPQLYSDSENISVSLLIVIVYIKSPLFQLVLSADLTKERPSTMFTVAMFDTSVVEILL